ncbi:unnamed protein product, partial [Discosporangium mesarthrocarpum]
TTAAPPVKPVVSRMLLVDPEVPNPKLVAGDLEDTTARLLGRPCVFDVASDVVEALADVRGDALGVYRVVFINDALHGIQGKQLARFFRKAGVGASLVLLVSELAQVDIDDFRAHGLNAVLRKPFTQDHLCDLLQKLCFSSSP